MIAAPLNWEQVVSKHQRVNYKGITPDSLSIAHSYTTFYRTSRKSHQACSTHTTPPSSPSNTGRCFSDSAAGHSTAAVAAAGSTHLAGAGNHPAGDSHPVEGSRLVGGNPDCGRRILVDTGAAGEACSHVTGHRCHHHLAQILCRSS